MITKLKLSVLAAYLSCEFEWLLIFLWCSS